jgi:diguanylate cyclase (GGDEF)-like protein
MLRLAEGDLDGDDGTRGHTAEIAEMQRAIAVFRGGMLERSRLNRETRLLSELTEWLQSCNSLQELYEMVAQFLSRLMPSCAGSLYIYAHSRDILESAKSWNGGKVSPTMHPEDCWGLRRGRVYTYGDNEIDFACAHLSGAAHGEYCCIPILAHGDTIGLLHLEFHCANDKCSTEEVAEQRRLGLVCAEQISLAIANVQLRDQLRDQSIRDPLTGLFNRRYMLETCRREFSRATRAGQPVSLLSIDVDHFKKFNDNHGHDAGDMVLRAVGECMETTFRNEDVSCRFGGEEFVVMLPGAPIEVAARRAEQLRAKVETLVVRYLEKNLPRITISTGVAAFPEAGENPEALLKAADEALYRAKAEGRNRVELSAFVGERKPLRKTPAVNGRRASDEPEAADREHPSAAPVLVAAADD